MHDRPVIRAATLEQIGTSRYVPARSLKLNDEIFVGTAIKRITSEPRYLNGYVYCEVNNVLGLGRGEWNFRADTEVAVLTRTPAR